LEKRWVFFERFFGKLLQVRAGVGGEVRGGLSLFFVCFDLVDFEESISSIE